MNDRQSCLKKKTKPKNQKELLWKVESNRAEASFMQTAVPQHLVTSPALSLVIERSQQNDTRLPCCPLGPTVQRGGGWVNSLFHTNFRLVLTFRDGRWRKVWDGWSFSYIIPFISQGRKDESETNMENRHNLNLSAECTGACLLRDFSSL